MRSNALLALRDGVIIANPIELQLVNGNKEEAVGLGHLQRMKHEQIVSLAARGLAGYRGLQKPSAATVLQLSKAPEMLESSWGPPVPLRMWSGSTKLVQLLRHAFCTFEQVKPFCTGSMKMS